MNAFLELCGRNARHARVRPSKRVRIFKEKKTPPTPEPAGEFCSHCDRLGCDVCDGTGWQK